MHQLKLLFRIEEGDFYIFKRKEVGELLASEMGRILDDRSVNKVEALHKVDLQRAFDLSYDQYLELTKEQMDRIVDEIAEERGDTIGKLLALDSVFRLSEKQKRILLPSTAKIDSVVLELDKLKIEIENQSSGLKTDTKPTLRKSQEEKVEEQVENETPETEVPLESLLIELNALVGLESAKAEVHEFVNFLKVQQVRKARGLPAAALSLHVVFYGNPGTGKTTVARLLSRIYKALGVLSKGHLVETDRSGLVAGYVGQTALKVTEVVEQSLGGVLFIDEAYSLSDGDLGGYGREAIDTLIKLMEDHREDFAVVIAGYTGRIEGFVSSNPGLKSRFNRYWKFDDFSPPELFSVFESLCAKGHFQTSTSAQAKLKTVLASAYGHRNESFGNARLVRNLFEASISNQASRIVSQKQMSDEALITIEAEDLPDAVESVIENETPETVVPLEVLLDELNALVGLQSAKAEVQELVNFLKVQQVRKAQGLPAAGLSLHVVFYGNPGTGKTTVARLLSRIYKALGVLSKGQLVETDRSGMVAGYVGQTALKVTEVVEQALGGVLFIDEAYSLSDGDLGGYGGEAIDTLIKLMEDHREDFAVVIAGYTGKIEGFLSSNPGLKSRFNRYWKFDDFSPPELFSVFESFCAKGHFQTSPSAKAKLKTVLASAYDRRNESFGNARLVRNLFEASISNQASRIVSHTQMSDEALSSIEAEDLPDAIESI